MQRKQLFKMLLLIFVCQKKKKLKVKVTVVFLLAVNALLHICLFLLHLPWGMRVNNCPCCVVKNILVKN